MTGPDFKRVDLCQHCGQRIFGDIAEHMKKHGLDWGRRKSYSRVDALVCMSDTVEPKLYPGKAIPVNSKQLNDLIKGKIRIGDL